MKRIYLFIALIALMATQTEVSAQTDIKLKHAIISDTMFYGGPISHIIRWRFINEGPVALVQSTDTLVLARAYTSGGPNTNRIRLTLPANGIPVGDSAQWTDTIHWNSAPSQNPYNWCDTVAVYRSGTLMTDPDPTDNFICKTIPFTQDKSSVEGIIANNSFKLYPNPATDKIAISYNLRNHAEEATLRIRSLVGQTVYEQKLTNNTAGNKEINVDISQLSGGIYIAELDVNGNKVVNKFTVVK